MKIALVHDYLKEMGGAERVLLTLSEMYPEATIYTAFYDRNSVASHAFQGKLVVTSSWGWLLKIGKMYSYLRFLLPWVWKSIDLSSYDLVISSCSGYIARGFVVGKKTRVIAYCHTPPRWLYGYDTPTGAQGLWWGRAYLWVVGPFVRYFDYVSAQRVDKWIANSREVANRIAKFYRKEAEVVYPPCEISDFRFQVLDKKPNKYWLIVSRIVGGKGLEIAALAAKAAKQQLVIVGTGDKKLQQKLVALGGSFVTLKGWVSDSEMSDIYKDAKGFLALARDEDFGMTVVESLARGVPVLAYNGGGYRETVQDQVNGALVGSLDPKVIASVMTKWPKFDQEKVRGTVTKFGKQRFEKEIRKIVGV